MKITIMLESGELTSESIEQVNFEMDNGNTFEVMEGENDSLWIQSTDLRDVHKQLATSPTAAGVQVLLHS